MQYNLINMLMFFFVYGFLDFILETVFRSAAERKLVISRGFLTNMFCPLYGICGIAIIQIFIFTEITITSRLAALILATVGSMLAVTVLEYASGRILDRVFGHKMWDYSNLPFNFHSYVCLDFSLMWGIISIILASIIHPLVQMAVYATDETTKIILLYFVFSILFINASYNFRKMYHLNLIRL